MHRLYAFFFVIVTALAQAPVVRLQLRTVGGQKQFHIGQPIPVTLTFETDSSQNFSVSTVVQPRRLRPQKPDQFSAEPATGWVDPLGDLTWTMAAKSNSMLSQPGATLDAVHPVAVERSLNEFIVFRKPGSYVVHCVSNRLSTGSVASLESSELPIDILPRDDAEDARQFSVARATLETGKPPKEPQRIIYQAEENAQAGAVRALRDLDTEAGATYLASIYGQGRRAEPDIAYAMYASGHRELIIRELERHLADSDLTLTQSYLITLIELKAHLQQSNTGHALSRADWTALDEAVERRAFELAGNKTPEAKAGTYFYLFQTGSRLYRRAPELRRLLVESLPFCSPSQVVDLLSSSWGEIREAGVELLPFLKQAVSRPWPQMSPNIAGLALLRLSELDSVSANEFAAAALRSGDFSISDQQLLEFSIPNSPELDRALLSQFRQGKPVEARIARFAGPGIKDELWRPKPECTTPLIAYFFRVDPDAAARQVAETRKSGIIPCMALQFSGLERLIMSPGLEQQLIQDTNGSDPNLRRAAYQTLTFAGSPAVLGVLLNSLQHANGAKQDIIRAVLQGRNWVLQDRDFAQLVTNCTGTSMCDEIARARRDSASPYTLRLFDLSGHRGVWLSNHEVDSLADLDERLMQYPPGAAFRWQTAGVSATGEERDMRNQVQVLLVKHGMRMLP